MYHIFWRTHLSDRNHLDVLIKKENGGLLNSDIDVRLSQPDQSVSASKIDP